MMMLDLAVARPLIDQGKLTVYGVTSAERVKSAPNIPTIAEAGLPGFAATGWFSVVLAAGTPRPIIDRLNGILMTYLKKPEVQDRLNAVAIDTRTSTPDEFKTFLASEIVKWAKVVKDAGIEPQ
jgi:tripartite-type tricarboxylate transporter receptor subunit TctC